MITLSKHQQNMTGTRPSHVSHTTDLGLVEMQKGIQLLVLGHRGARC